MNIPFALRLLQDLKEELSRRYEGYASSVGGLFNISIVLPSFVTVPTEWPTTKPEMEATTSRSRVSNGTR